MAMLDAIDLDIALQVCDALETVIKSDDDANCDHSAINAIVGIRRTNSNESAMNALDHALDAIKAAKASALSSETAWVTSSVQKCVEAVYDDHRVSRGQIAILVHSDIDQVRFACQELGIKKQAGLTGRVICRMVPWHPLRISDPVKSIEDENR